MHDVKKCKKCQKHLKVVGEGAQKLMMELIITTKDTHLHAHAPAPIIAIEIFEAAAAMFGALVELEINRIDEKDDSEEDKITNKKGLAHWAVTSAFTVIQDYLPVKIQTIHAESEEDLKKTSSSIKGTRH